MVTTVHVSIESRTTLPKDDYTWEIDVLEIARDDNFDSLSVGFVDIQELKDLEDQRIISSKMNRKLSYSPTGSRFVPLTRRFYCFIPNGEAKALFAFTFLDSPSYSTTIHEELSYSKP
uniref:CUB domain-containing protein n=1 Tax=Heterorhabditis bacteriophora TaxID=37862 RepID=A0A1I7XQ30_HETBA